MLSHKASSAQFSEINLVELRAPCWMQSPIPYGRVICNENWSKLKSSSSTYKDDMADRYLGVAATIFLVKAANKSVCLFENTFASLLHLRFLGFPIAHWMNSMTRTRARNALFNLKARSEAAGWGWGRFVLKWSTKTNRLNTIGDESSLLRCKSTPDRPKIGPLFVQPGPLWARLAPL